MEREELEVIYSPSETEKESKVMGIPNSYFPYALVAVFLALVGYFILVPMLGFVLGIIISALPLIITMFILFKFFIGKPAHYASDSFNCMTSSDFHLTRPKKAKLNPIYEVEDD